MKKWALVKKKIVCVGVSYEIMLALGGLKEGEMV